MTLSKLSARSCALAALLLCAGASFAATTVVATPAPAAKPAAVAVVATPAVAAKPAAVAVVSTSAPLSSASLAGAITACSSLALNASCSFKDTKGTVSGQCYTARDKAKACMPLQKAGK
jgi:hypothetical protein